MASPEQYHILLVEDNANDVLFIERAIRRGNLPFILYHVQNGEEAVSYLLGNGQYGDREQCPLPNLVISNMKMPRMNGLQLWQWIRQQPEWDQLPIVVLSSSGDPTEVKQLETLGANSYFIKPVDLNDLVDTLKQITAWLPPLV
jgi:CheY-like chemotaxis protein